MDDDKEVYENWRLCKRWGGNFGGVHAGSLGSTDEEQNQKDRAPRIEFNKRTNGNNMHSWEKNVVEDATHGAHHGATESVQSHADYSIQSRLLQQHSTTTAPLRCTDRQGNVFA